MTYEIIDCCMGYGISKRDARYPGRELYFGGYRKGEPQWYTDFTWTRWFKTVKTLDKHLAILHEKEGF